MTQNQVKSVMDKKIWSTYERWLYTYLWPTLYIVAVPASSSGDVEN